ncbi:hypothetical protein CYMTET_54278 [Cymbomonas tetramitiformis]|uniref:Uncharacterized protein n=1 Tax=Cymbomonas tetramitiformis TaxID=36881 RepID=A0AAE0BFE7_9CHLO|nr:hypothetical protein CYMTET_54278 [Cymbomonas tetramitiformis]
MSHRFAREDVVIDSNVILNLERLYHTNHCARYCRKQLFDVACTGAWIFDGIDELALKKHPGFTKYVKRKLKRFIEQALDQIFVQGFTVYRVIPESKHFMYPFACVVPVDEMTTYVIKRKNNPENVVSTMVNNESCASFFLASNGDSKKGVAPVTYYYAEDEPDPRTGDVRSIMRSVYYQISLTQNMEHSAMYSERAKSIPNVLTKRKTDQAFDERFLTNDVDTISDARAMLVMENMQLREHMDNALQTQKSERNQQAAVTRANRVEMSSSMYQVPDALENWSGVPRFVPLPMDADVAPSPNVGARGDLTTLQANCDSAIRKAFGVADAGTKGYLRSNTNTQSQDPSNDNVPARKIYSTRTLVQSILRDVWTVCYAPLFPDVEEVTPMIHDADFELLHIKDPWKLEQDSKKDSGTSLQTPERLVRSEPPKEDELERRAATGAQ